MIVLLSEMASLLKGEVDESLRTRAAEYMERYESFGVSLPVTDANITTGDVVEVWANGKGEFSANDLIGAVDWDRVEKVMHDAGIYIIRDTMARI